MRGSALLLLTLLCPALPLTVLDTPYEETLRSTLPYAAPWAGAAALPTGWAALPPTCDAITSLALADMTYLSDSAHQARALLLCRSPSGQAALLDALTRAPLALPPLMNASLPWLLAGQAAAHAAALPLLALSGCGSGGAPPSLAWLSCSLPHRDAQGGGRCAAQALALPTEHATLPCDAQMRLWVHGPLPGAPGASLATLWLSSPTLGTLALALEGGASPRLTQAFASPAPSTAVAYSAALARLALGNATSLALYDATAAPPGLALRRVEWASDTANGWGGPIDDAITALLWEDRSGRDLLYIGTPTALNTYRAATGLIGRLAGRDGLPATNITSLALDASYEGRVWLGTTTGLVLYDATVAPTPPLPPSRLQAGAATAAAAAAPPQPLPWRTRWRFFSGARWLPPASPATPTATGCAFVGGAPFPLLSLPPEAAGGALAPAPPSSTLTWPLTLGRLAGPNASVWAVGGGAGALLSATVGGLGVLASSQWTLESKAAYYEAQLPLFDLAGPLSAGGTGLTGGANCPSFGAWDAAVTSPDDNNGLWTSLLVTAFSAKANATRQGGSAAALASAYLQGLLNLNAVTGIEGLFARSTLPPGHGLPDATWRNSSSRAGWVWKGDTSSDETAGHVCAYSALAQWVGGGAPAATAAAQRTLVNFCRYVLRNNLTLIDSTGQRTTWGFWDAETINFSRRYSDTRGVNSAEALAMVAGALVGARGAGSGAAANDTAAFAAMLQRLLSPAIGYDQNLRNLKIAAPDDDNFSDDELTFVSYLPLFLALEQLGGNSTHPQLHSAALASLSRTWALLTPTRPHAWHVFALGLGAAAGGGGGGGGGGGSEGMGELATPTPQQAMVDVLWGLRGWPLEPLDWPVDNGGRADVYGDASLNRAMQAGAESRNVFPPNERPYQRLNADPCDLRGGGGMYAMDQAAFLLPYWLARLWGLIAQA